MLGRGKFFIASIASIVPIVPIVSIASIVIYSLFYHFTWRVMTEWAGMVTVRVPSFLAL